MKFELEVDSNGVVVRYGGRILSADEVSFVINKLGVMHKMGMGRDANSWVRM